MSASDGITFDGEVAIVTGAGSGIGRATALNLAGRGASVVVNDIGRHEDGEFIDGAAAVVDEIVAAGGKAVANRDSVSTPEGGQGIVGTALREFGGLDIVAGIAGNMRPNRFEKSPLEDFNLLLEVHLGGVVNVFHPAWEHMRHGSGGRLVIMSSLAAVLGGVGYANYSAAKAAQLGFMHALADEGRECGVKVNAVFPWARGTQLGKQVANSAIYTERTDMPTYPPEQLAEMQPERVSQLVVALAHRDCPYTDEVFCAYGRFFSRFWWSMGRGWIAPNAATAGDIVEHWNEIADGSAPTECVGDPADFNVEIMKMLSSVPVAAE